MIRKWTVARVRLNRALKEAGLTQADLDGGVSGNPAAYVGDRTVHCTLAPGVCRRWAELHALRTEMVERNLYLVLINAARCVHKAVGRADLIQDVFVVLVRVVPTFHYEPGRSFRAWLS